jgi:hypothetical protein
MDNLIIVEQHILSSVHPLFIHLIKFNLPLQSRLSVKSEVAFQAFKVTRVIKVIAGITQARLGRPAESKLKV